MQIKPIFKNILKFTKKHAPKILAGSAILSEIVGFYFMHKEAPIVRKKLDELDKDATLMDKLKVAGPIYLPAFLMLVASGACTIGTVVIGESRIAAATNAAVISEALASQYEKKLVEAVGAEKAQQMQDEIVGELAQKQMATSDVIFDTGHGEDIYFDILSGRYFRASDDFIAQCVININEKISNQYCMWAEVNEWYDELGLENVYLAKDRGWNPDHPFRIKIGEWISMPDGRPCKPISYVQKPVDYADRNRKND